MKKTLARKVSGELLGKAGTVAKTIPSPDAFAFIASLSDAYRESQITKKEIAKIDAQRDVLIEGIRQHYDFYRALFEKVFDERRAAIDKAFAVIDRGIDRGDNEIIVGGLKVLGEIVSSSPFKNAESLREALLTSGKIEI